MKKQLHHVEDSAGASQRVIALPDVVNEHLRVVFEQMDLLLASKEVDAGLGNLLSMLKHLRALRRFLE